MEQHDGGIKRKVQIGSRKAHMSVSGKNGETKEDMTCVYTERFSVTLQGKKLLLIIGGGIAAYKILSLLRLLKQEGMEIETILTRAGAAFVTPLSISALSSVPPRQDLFSPQEETQMGHIALSRQADLIVIAPATADLIAKAALGLANDLASATLLAANKPVCCVPSMNPEMWKHPATQAHIQTLKSRDHFFFCGPESGEMACGETGMGRMSEAEEIFQLIKGFFLQKGLLAGKKVVLTSGPTFEPIDAVRYIGNRSSGKQGYAIARALACYGAEVVLISGPVSLKTPEGVKCIRVETAQQMYHATQEQLPADIAICTAAVCDWKPDNPVIRKLKKGKDNPHFTFSENPDILHMLSTHKKRPDLVVGFAAETENILAYAQEKRKRKKCDWIFANDISKGVMGGDQNQVIFIHQSGHEVWPVLDKTEIGMKLAESITQHFLEKKSLKMRHQSR